MHPTPLLLLLTPTIFAAIHTIAVGQRGQTFSPQTLDAEVGDTVIFHLYPNHDVAQGEFGSPCQPSESGFYSGSYSGTDGGEKKFVINVTSTDPVYYYCGVQRHCAGGMVGGINIPTDGDTIEAYADAAEGKDSTSPTGLRGGEMLDDGQIAELTKSAGGSATATATTTGSASRSSATSGSAASASATTTSAGSASSAASAATASSTGAAGVLTAGQPYGIVAGAFGFAALVF